MRTLSSPPYRSNISIMANPYHISIIATMIAVLIMISTTTTIIVKANKGPFKNSNNRNKKTRTSSGSEPLTPLIMDELTMKKNRGKESLLNSLPSQSKPKIIAASLSTMDRRKSNRKKQKKERFNTVMSQISDDTMIFNEEQVVDSSLGGDAGTGNNSNNSENLTQQHQQQQQVGPSSSNTLDNGYDVEVEEQTTQELSSPNSNSAASTTKNNKATQKPSRIQRDEEWWRDPLALFDDDDDTENDYDYLNDDDEEDVAVSEYQSESESEVESKVNNAGQGDLTASVPELDVQEQQQVTEQLPIMSKQQLLMTGELDDDDDLYDEDIEEEEINDLYSSYETETEMEDMENQNQINSLFQQSQSSIPGMQTRFQDMEESDYEYVDEDEDEYYDEDGEEQEEFLRSLGEDSTRNKNNHGGGGLSMEAQRRLAQHSIIMKPDSPSKSPPPTSSSSSSSMMTKLKPSRDISTSSSTDSNISSLPTLLLLTKLRDVITLHPPVITAVVSVVTGQFLISNLFKKMRKSGRNDYLVDEDEEEDDQTFIEEEEEEDDYMMDEYNMNRSENSHLPFLSRFSKPFSSSSSSTFQDTHYSSNVHSRTAANGQNSQTTYNGPDNNNNNGYTGTGGIVRGRSFRDRGRIAELEQEHEMQVKFWKDRVERMETENENLLNLSDKLSKELEKTKTRSSTLEKTMKSLKTQFRTEQKNMENSIRKQQRKNQEEEMKKVREALLKVLHHERTLMREQVKKTSEQVKALILEKQVEEQEREREREQEEVLREEKQEVYEGGAMSSRAEGSSMNEGATTTEKRTDRNNANYNENINTDSKKNDAYY